MFLPGFIAFSYENVIDEITAHSLVVTSHSIDDVVFTNSDGDCFSNDMMFK